MSRQLGNGFYSQGNYVTGQQPIPQTQHLLSHPTRYHLEETERRRQTLNNDECSPPTPAGSFHNTLDPETLQQSSYMEHIKQESGSYDIRTEMDYSVISPVSGSPFGSPRNNLPGYDAEDFPQSYRASSHLESIGGASPSHDNNNDYFVDTEFSPMSAPTSIPVDVKPSRIGNRQPINIYNGQISMSLPVGSWPYGTSVEQIQPGSLPYSSGTDLQMMSNYLDADEADNHKQAMLSEKRRRRRESHNAVERRRRDNINEKIAELSTLLPEMYIDSTNKPNKGVILRRSVDYIRDLQRLLQENNRLLEEHRLRNSELEARVRDMSAPRTSMEGTSGGSSAKRSDLNSSSLSSSSLDGSPQTPSLGSNNLIS